MDQLFSPMQIRGVNIRNRIAVPAMVEYNLTDPTGHVTPPAVEHYRDFACGGAGLIIQEATCVSETGKLTPNQLGIWNDSHVEGLGRIVEAVHREGGVIFIQLHHAGIFSITETPECPSDFVSTHPRSGQQVQGHAMSPEQIALVQRQFADACCRAVEAGYDGIELHGCHNYLISQFFNREVNGRTDQYGQNPALFALEVLRQVRETVGDDTVIGMRLGGFEPTLSDGIRHAQTLAKAGIDFLDISFGFLACSQPEVPEGFPFSPYVYAAQKIREMVKVPVFAANDITTAPMAREILQTTGVDLVDIGRGMLINPDWARCAEQGLETGSCINCSVCMFRTPTPERCPGLVRYLKEK